MRIRYWLAVANHWRLTRLRPEMARYVWATRIHPSPLQREFNRGDPDGKVRAIADEILRELKAEEEAE